ncbi:hypothetical protein F2Q68_00015459 [Brassica cretica]|uniref:Uncharacterized protein n=1 Tax=Brassica cretica TaxID=69181 RepID=A0A8S9HHE6_BRACR|nr:hypothetical protein F2Q68_00015459 [Brassica cretica]
MVKTSELQPHHLQKIKETTTRLRSNTKEPILIWVQNEFWLEWNPCQQDQRNGPPGRTQTLGSPIRERFRSPLEGTPSSIPGTELPSKKWKTSDKENFPYFRIYYTSSARFLSVYQSSGQDQTEFKSVYSRPDQNIIAGDSKSSDQDMTEGSERGKQQERG